NSQLANARFQAAGAIRDAALREWVFLEVDDKRGLIRSARLILVASLQVLKVQQLRLAALRALSVRF
ncbi:hypothetical protein HAX54_019214, partial [Datura stramonium]|nr:hypothetical protein [Datura stramonium]